MLACAAARRFGVEDLLKLPLEERVYRLRCVEAWSMVIPWIGFEFNQLARLVEPTSKAKFVEFVTAAQSQNMPGLRTQVLRWPYTEGLRIDEAMHPLTILALGLYGEVLPNQNGAPVRLGANPAEFITRATGDWTLRFLLLALAVTPLRKLCGWPELARFRRMLGLCGFFYGVAHLTSYLAFDHAFNAVDIVKDIVKRPFITVGFMSLMLMAPLAVTSTNAMVKRLGAKRRLALHKLVYLIAPLGVLHFWWMVKKDVSEPALYAVLLAALLGYRLAVKLASDWRAMPTGASIVKTPRIAEQLALARSRSNETAGIRN